MKVNVKQSDSNKFKYYFKQLAVPFKIYTGFECNVKGGKSNDKNNNASYTRKYQDHIPCSFAYNFGCINDRFTKKVALYRGKIQSINLLKQS